MSQSQILHKPQRQNNFTLTRAAAFQKQTVIKATKYQMEVAGNSNKGKRKADGVGGPARLSKHLAKKKRADPDADTAKHRNFKWVHTKVLAEQVTLAVFQHGIRLAAVTDKVRVDGDDSIIGWDMISRIVTQEQEGPVVSLKECFEKLSPTAVNFISEITIGGWGFAANPVENHVINVSREDLGYITSALVSATLDNGAAEVCVSVHRLMTAHAAFTTLRTNPYYEKVRKVRNELKAMWGNLDNSATAAALRAVQTEYEDVFKKEVGLHNMFKVIVMAAKDDRYTNTLRIMEEAKPYERLHELGDFSETRQIMMMSPAREQFMSYMAETAVDIMSIASKSRPKIVFPPRMDKLISDAGIKLDKTPVYQDFMKTALGIGSETPEITSKQACAADQFKKDCVFEMSKAIFWQNDISAWTDDDYMKVLSKKTIKVDEKETVIGIVDYTDKVLKEIHDDHSPSTEYKKIQWKELIIETHTRIKQSVLDSVMSYITTNKVSMLDNGGFVEQEFSPIATILQVVVKSMFASDEEFEEIKKTMGKPAKSDREASEKCAPIALTFDHVDVDDREEVAKQVYNALKGIPKIVQTFGSKFLFYVREIDLASSFVVKPIYTALKDGVFGKNPKLMGCAPFLARDFLFVVCQAAGHQHASTFAAFADKVERSINCHTNKCNFIYQEPKEGGGRYHQVDTSADNGVYIQFPEETQAVDGNEGASEAQPVILVDPGFKVTIFSTTAKTFEDFSKERILAACDNDEVQYISGPTGEEGREGESEDDEEAGRANHTAGAKPIPENQYLDADAKAEIHLLISWIREHIKDDPQSQEGLLHGIYAAIPHLEKKITFNVFTGRIQYTTKIISHMVSILAAVDLHEDNKKKLEKCITKTTSTGKARALPFTTKLDFVLKIIEKEWEMAEPTDDDHQDDDEQSDDDAGAAALIQLSAKQHPQTQVPGEEDDDEDMGSDEGAGSDSSHG